MRVVYPEEMLAMDRYCVSSLGIPGIGLMENAGSVVASVVAGELSGRRGTTTILCGPGNNGGDGFVAARHLNGRGLDVLVYALSTRDRFRGDAATALNWLEQCGVPVSFVTEVTDDLRHAIYTSAVVVDSVFGTGLNSDVTGFYADVVGIVNHSSALRICVDIPSGVDGRSGRIRGTAVQGDVTVTFAYPKLGQLIYPGRAACGRLIVAKIGMPEASLSVIGSDIHLIVPAMVGKLIRRRVQPSHKGTYGRVAVIAGSAGMLGAAVLSCLGALRAGAGTVVCALPASLRSAFHSQLVEAMSIGLPEDAYGMATQEAVSQAVSLLRSSQGYVIGPGLGRSEGVARFVVGMLRELRASGVIDADALIALGRSGVDLTEFRDDIILTPHPGEMSALTGMQVVEILADPVGVCSRAATEWRKIVVLKGATSVVSTPSGRTYLCTAGNPGMATGGSGDVLAGIIGAFVAGGASPEDAAVAGVYVHARAGDLASEQVGQSGMIASEIASRVPKTVTMLLDTMNCHVDLELTSV